MRSKLLAAAGALLILAGCSGDSQSGPTGPQHANVAGSWTYNATNLSGTVMGFAMTCNIEGMTLNLTQTGTSFGGTCGPSIITCFGGGVQVDDTLPGSVVVNGLVNGNNVQFDIETSDYHNTGTMSGSSMSGTVSIRLDLGDEVVTLTGNWAAAQTASGAIRGNTVGALTEGVEDAVAQTAKLALVIRTDCTIQEEALLLLHNAGEEGLTRADLVAAIPRPDSSIQRALTRLASAEKREIIRRGDQRYVLTPNGSRRIQKELGDKLSA